MKVFNSMEELVGNTPLLRLKNIEKEYSLKARLFAKLEGVNPTGSVKDRTAKELIFDAEERGLLEKGGTVIEPTSGNTGIALAMLCKAKGYKAVIVMPETMSIERRKLMLSYGAELVLTDGDRGMQGAIEKAQELQKTIPNSFIPDQFSNPANWRAHYKTTGVEIYQDLDGDVSAFVASVGTGGTFTGTAKFLKEKNAFVKAFAVEPSESAVLSGEEKGAHGIQGIGAGFIPKVLDTQLIDEVIKVSTKQSVEYAKMLVKTEGVSAGISSGATVFGGIEVAKREEFAGKNVVVVLPDSAWKYLSTELFED
ncbi:MAG: cysteine synthase A [Clostridiales bacterium]|nr:cysteine synthase A [Clostridiales bacterium]